MPSSLHVERPRLVLPSTASRERTRRDFLAWLAAVPALSAIGCAATTATDPGTGDDPTGSEPDVEPDEDVDFVEQDWHTCRHTSRDATGPYYEAGAPIRTRIAAPNEPGVRLLVEGRVFGPDCRTPLAGYALDLWQADARGNYYEGGRSDYRLRGKVVTDTVGRYRFETVLPGRYGDSAGIRPAHIHARMLTPGGNALLTTQIYFAGDPYLGDADYCTRSGTCNSRDPARALRLADALVGGRVGKRARFDVFLPRS